MSGEGGKSGVGSGGEGGGEGAWDEGMMTGKPDDW